MRILFLLISQRLFFIRAYLLSLAEEHQLSADILQKKLIEASYLPSFLKKILQIYFSHSPWPFNILNLFPIKERVFLKAQHQSINIEYLQNYYQLKKIYIIHLVYFILGFYLFSFTLLQVLWITGYLTILIYIIVMGVFFIIIGYIWYQLQWLYFLIRTDSLCLQYKNISTILDFLYYISNFIYKKSLFRSKICLKAQKTLSLSFPQPYKTVLEKRLLGQISRETFFKKLQLIKDRLWWKMLFIGLVVWYILLLAIVLT